MRKLLLIITIVSGIVNAQTPLNLLTKKASAAPPSSVIVAKIDFRASGTSTGLTNWNTLAGNPSTAVLSIANMIDTTGASTGWSFSSNATNAWSAYSGSASNNAVAGITGGTAMPGASTQSYQSIMYNYGTISPARYDATKWQFQIGGLDNTKTYTIRICGSEGTLGFDNRYYVIRAVGGTSSSVVEIDGGPGGGGGFTTVDTYGEISCTPSGGVIKIWLNSEASGAGGSSDLATICSMRITQN